MRTEAINNTPETPAIQLISTPPEKPIQLREWLQAAVEITLLVVLVIPLWTILGIVLSGPALLLKKCSSHFSEANQKRINQLLAFSTEIFTLLAFGVRFLTAYGKPLENVERKGRPILLVHGYLHNSSAWFYFLKRLSEKGCGPIYTINLGHPFLPLSEYANRVAAKAEEIRQLTGRDDLTLIGHSMGGVVCSLYATKLAPAGRVKEVFTLGSPLSGSHLARTFGVGPDGREMQSTAPILAEILAGIEEKKDEIDFYHAGSDADLLVSAKSALSGSGEELLLTDLGHLHFLVSETIVDWIAKRLLATRL